MKLTHKQEVELLTSISARGEIPVKYVYFGDGAKRWDEIYKEWDKSGNLTNEELQLLLKHVDGFLNAFSQVAGINVIDLGCGNGMPAVAILKEIKKRNVPVKYVAVDISQEMLDLAKSNVESGTEKIPAEYVLADFEKESLTDKLLAAKQENGYANLLINLGNTLGNYVNVSGVLTTFLESMTLDDYLLIGNGLTNNFNEQRIINTYDTPLIIETVTSPAKALGIFSPDQDTFSYSWNARLQRVEGRIKLATDKQVKLAGQSFMLKKNEEVLVHRSHKYDEAGLMKLLSDVGFRTELLTTTKDRNHILVMIQPTRYSVA